jgi:single-stranded DNA-binding protein ssbB
MHNVVYLIGRLTEDPTLKSIGEEKDMLTINLAVQRSYKNENGIYETDFIRCILWNGIAKNTSEYCHKGDLVGVKGRLQTRKYEDENKEDKYITEVIVDKVSFLASKRETE